MEWTDPAHFVDWILGHCPQDSLVTSRLVGSLVLPIVVFQMTRVEGELDHKMFKFSCTQRMAAQYVRSFQNTYSRIRGFPDQESYVKFWIDKYMALGLRDRNPYPISEEYGSTNLFSGVARKFVLRQIARKKVSFLYSLQKGSKQSWLPLPPTCLKKAYEKHRKLICREPETTSAEVLDSIRSVSNEIFRGIEDSECVKFQPTGSACLTVKRKDGGTGSLVPKLTLPDPVVAGKQPSLTHTVQKLYHHQHSSLRFCLAKLKEKIINNGYADTLTVKATGLAEPGKFRILTFMDGDLANSLQPIQSAMLNRWKHSPYSTMLTEDLTDRLESLVKFHLECTGFRRCVSGDYSSATDTLRRDESFAALSGLSDSSWYPLAEMSLLPGKIIYPPVKDGRSILSPEVVDMQTEGQLMGHLLSFPLLCCINLSTYRLALRRWVEKCAWDDPERERREWVMCQCMDKVIINGDDICFFADDELYQCWLEVVREHSFLPSAGKNYLTDHFIQMNSQLFSINWATGKVSRKGYLQQRIIYGQDVKKTSDIQGGPIETARDLNRMISLCPPARACVKMTMQRFSDWTFGYHRANWYAPVVLGGYGLVPEGKVKYTPAQRHVASDMTNKPRKLYWEAIRKENPLRFLMGRKRIVFGDYVAEESLVEEGADTVGEKIMVVNSWIGMGESPSRRRKKIFLKPNTRLRPMCPDSFEVYRHARHFVVDRKVRYPRTWFTGKCLPLIAG